MTKPNNSGENSAWAGISGGLNAHLVAADPPKRLEVGGSPVTEQSHEYVISKKPGSDA